MVEQLRFLVSTQVAWVQFPLLEQFLVFQSALIMLPNTLVLPQHDINQTSILCINNSTNLTSIEELYCYCCWNVTWSPFKWMNVCRKCILKEKNVASDMNGPPMCLIIMQYNLWLHCVVLYWCHCWWWNWYPSVYDGFSAVWLLNILKMENNETTHISCSF